MKPLLFLLALLVAFGTGGCDSHDIGGASVGEDLPFDLILPTNQTPADYYAESGIALRTQKVVINDTVQEKTSSTYYAQFRAARGNRPPAKVTVNGNGLVPLRSGSDTLRLASATGLSLYGENLWTVRDSTGDSASFTTAKVDGIDSVAPFNYRSTFRRDTSIALRWNRPSSGSSGMYITWIGPDKYTYTQPVNDDIGAFTIPKDVMQRLAGRGRVYFTRHITFERSFKGKSIILKRMVQRMYEVTVE